MYQGLLIAEKLINCDEIGKTKLCDTLKKICIEMNYVNINLEKYFENENFNDIFEEITAEKLKLKKTTQGYDEDSRIIDNNFDLILIIVRLLIKISDGNLVITQIIQLASELQPPENLNEEHQILNKRFKTIEETVLYFFKLINYLLIINFFLKKFI